MNRSVPKALDIIRWTARIWGALASIVYIYIWLAYAAKQPQSPINLIAVFITIVALGLAWRWEPLGGALAIVAVLTRIIVDFYQSGYRYNVAEYWHLRQMDLLGWVVLFIAPALLFLTFWVLSRIRLRKGRRKKAA